MNIPKKAANAAKRILFLRVNIDSPAGPPASQTLTIPDCVLARGSALHLGVNPSIGFFHPFLKRNARLPIEHFLDQCVVAVAAIDALRSIRLVVTLQLDAGDFLNNADELVDGDLLRAAQV